MKKPDNKKKTPPMKPESSCDTCAYYDVIDEDGALGCVVDVDEDELARERQDSRNVCPYYRFYDEYKLVQKQN